MKPSSIRIVAGQFKGRTIPTLPGRTTRPTSHRAREALFSILGGLIQDATVADLFAGTGAVGMEALSRGATKALFVEQNPLAGKSIQRMLTQLNVSHSSQVVIEDVSLAIQNSILVGWRPFDMIFMDPPYRLQNVQQILHYLEEADVMAPTGRLIYEHFHKTTPPIPLGKWSLIRTARYGDTALTFYRPVPLTEKDFDQ